MDQARYWMWAKRKHNSLSSSSHLDNHHLQVPITNPSIDDASWEEQAFAEDAAGPLGGCIWPPRSYSCSFCKREFRSAQALGGHMNVHRRDRARLKQSPNDETALQNHHLLQDGTNPFGSSFQFPSRQVCALVYNNNNPKTSTSPPSPTSRVSGFSGLSAQLPPCKEQCADHQQTLIPPPSLSSVSSPGQSWSTFSTNRCNNDNSDKSIPRNIAEAEKISRAVESRPRAKAKGDHNLSVSLNLVVRCNRPSSVSDGDEEQHEAVISCKRRRLSDEDVVVPSSVPFFLKSSSVERVQRHELQSAQGTLELGCTGSIEELDLELRLGDRRDKVIKVDK